MTRLLPGNIYEDLHPIVNALVDLANKADTDQQRCDRMARFVAFAAFFAVKESIEPLASARHIISGLDCGLHKCGMSLATQITVDDDRAGNA